MIRTSGIPGGPSGIGAENVAGTQRPDGVLATHTGVEFVRDAKKVLDLLTDLERSARLNARRESGTPFKVGGIPTQQFSILVDVLAAANPGQEVTSRTVRETGTLTALLGSGELDVVVLRGSPASRSRCPTASSSACCSPSRSSSASRRTTGRPGAGRSPSPNWPTRSGSCPTPTTAG